MTQNTDQTRTLGQKTRSNITELFNKRLPQLRQEEDEELLELYVTDKTDPQAPPRPHDFSYLHHHWDTFENDYEISEMYLKEIIDDVIADLKEHLALHPTVIEALNDTINIASDAAWETGTGAVRASLIGHSLLLRPSQTISPDAIAQARTAVTTAAATNGVLAAMRTITTMLQAARDTAMIVRQGPDPRTTLEALEALNSAASLVSDITQEITQETHIHYIRAWQAATKAMETGTT